MDGLTARAGAGALCLIGIGLMASACGHKEVLMERDTPFLIGSTTIHIAERWVEHDGLAFIHLHEDEGTSLRSALNVLPEIGGRVVSLKHTGDRFITFALEADTFSFDPNRMFTDEGAALTLERNGSLTDEAHRAVRTFADSVLNRYRIHEADVVVALHNNRPNGYSVLSYTDDGEYADDAADVHVAEGRDINDFFFVTERTFFDHFRAHGFNVVLQENESVTDDGSLSVYCGVHEIPYINIEAAHGAREEQVRMIRAVAELLRSRPRPA